MTDSYLEDLLSTPTPALIRAMKELEGDLLAVGAGGKMGPSLVRLAVRASREAGVSRRIYAASRFFDGSRRSALEAAGAIVVQCDLFEPAHVAGLPDAANVVYMVGQKFGTTSDSAGTWAVNAFLPGVVAGRFASSRIVAFSTGNVYPLWPVASDGPAETDATGPIGEYAESALVRERVLEYFGRRNDTPMAILRVNYAIEPRYGVLRDVADRVRAGEPVDLGMALVNVIWQRDANAIALRALAHCAVPPLVLNVTGRAVGVRAIANAFGARWGLVPRFAGIESATALLSNPSRSEALFGRPDVSLEDMIGLVADWMDAGGRSLGKPTRFEVRDGRY